MYNLIQKRFNPQTTNYELLHEQAISETEANQISNYFIVNTHRPEGFYEYNITGPEGVQVFHSAIGDLMGFIKSSKQYSN